MNSHVCDTVDSCIPRIMDTITSGWRNGTPHSHSSIELQCTYVWVLHRSVSTVWGEREVVAHCWGGLPWLGFCLALLGLTGLCMGMVSIGAFGPGLPLARPPGLSTQPCGCPPWLSRGSPVSHSGTITLWCRMWIFAKSTAAVARRAPHEPLDPSTQDR